MSYVAPTTNVAAFITQRLGAIDATQREVATQCGYANANIITMFKTGATKVPVEIAPDLARALDVDPEALVRLVLKEYLPGAWATIESLMADPGPMTIDERELVELVREASGGHALELHNTSNRIRLRDAVRECIARNNAVACAARSRRSI
jgi:hypothetical protein